MGCTVFLVILHYYIQMMTADLSLGTISIPSCKFGVYGIESEADVINDGWVRLTINDLNNADIKSQLITEYNANGGLFNFIQPFSLSNCCWRVYDSTSGSTFTFSLSTGTATYYFPAPEPSAMECTSNPTSSTYGFYDSTNNVHLTSLSPTVTFSTTSGCGVGNNPSIYAKCCEFAVYDYSDADNTAATNNWIGMNYADFQSSSPYKEFFINAYNLNSNLMKTIASWTLSNCAITYGEGTSRIQINGGSGYLRMGTSCASLNFGTSYTMYSSSSSTAITSLSISDQFTVYSCCSNNQNPGFYRKCTAGTLPPTTTTTTSPTPSPTTYPTPSPTSSPTPAPTQNPTPAPTLNPIPAPTNNPTPSPTTYPTPSPTPSPTPAPTLNPTPAPTLNPTPAPTLKPTPAPTLNPTPAPTLNPIPAPTNNPTPSPTAYPTPSPTNNPSKYPTKTPTKIPTVNPTDNPTPSPTTNPTKNPTKYPTKTPSISPTISTVNPSKNPTLYPTLYPSVSPSRNPTPGPTLPEGVVIDITDNSNENTYSNDNDELKSENVFFLLNSNNIMVYIIIGVAVILLICCIILFVMFLRKKRKKRVSKQNTTEYKAEGMGVNSSASTVPMTRIGSVSPRSMNSFALNAMSFETTGGVNEGGTPMGIETNYDNNNAESDDGDNELFVDTGAHVTAGGDNEIHLPALPDNNNNTSDEESDNQNELYKKQVTNTGGAIDMDLYENVHKISKLCGECGQSFDVTDGGKVDENDGNWYCHNCWNSFYD